MSVRLFVGNLPYSATEADIRQHFGTIGEPIQVVIPTDRDTGRPRGFAFVDYDDRGVAERAIQQLHGQPFKGRPLSVSEARPREARPPAGAGGFSSPRPPMGGGPPRPPMGGAPSGDVGPYRQRGGIGGGGDSNRNFGPNKPPKGRGGSNFAKNRNQEGKARGPLKERLSGRMFSVDEDSRFRDEDDTGVDEVELLAKDEDVKEDIKEDVKDDE
jgi:cold-inducible RNA-binding protein